MTTEVEALILLVEGGTQRPEEEARPTRSSPLVCDFWNANGCESRSLTDTLTGNVPGAVERFRDLQEALR
jgi:hypothetical protein